MGVLKQRIIETGKFAALSDRSKSPIGNSTWSQRAMVAAMLATLKHGGDRSKSQICDLTQEQAAAALNVGKRTVEHACVVRDCGDAALIDAVRYGERKARRQSVGQGGAELGVDGMSAGGRTREV